MSLETQPVTSFLSHLQENPSKTVANRYSQEVYSKYKHDSPNESRKSLITRVHEKIDSFTKEDIILDLGGGRQIFVKEYAQRFGPPPGTMVTLDFADIKEPALLGKNNSYHIRGDASKLPIKDNTTSLIISNTAFEYFRAFVDDKDQPIKEMWRIMKPDSPALLNLLHPDYLIPNLDIKLRYPNMFMEYNPESLAIMKYIQDAHVLFSTADEIKNKFSEFGFDTLRVVERKNASFPWWEVDLHKPKHLSSIFFSSDIFTRNNER